MRNIKILAASLISLSAVFIPSLVSGKESYKHDNSLLGNDFLHASLLCRFLGLCDNDGSRGDDYCPIVPNYKSISLWRERPVFAFFDIEGTAEKIELYDSGSSDQIWSHRLEADNQAAQTLHVIAHSDDLAIADDSIRNLSAYSGESFHVRFHQSPNLPELESGQLYDYAIRATDSDETADIHERLPLELVANELMTAQISEDIEELQQNQTADELTQALFSYFSEPFNSDRAGFQFLPDEDIFLLDAFFYLLSLPTAEQTTYFQDLYQVLDENCIGGTQTEP